MYMSSNSVDVKVAGFVGTIVLNRPGRRNALTRSMLSQLQQALADLHMEKRVRAVVLTGAGTAFCAGMDIHEMHAAATLPDQVKQQEWGDTAEAYRELVVQMIELPKPIIASVNGPAVGGGAGLVLASDIVVGCGSAQFGLPETRRGVVAGIVGPLLAFRVGAGTAARLLLTSELYPADEAYRLGIYHEMIDDTRLWARCAQLGEECAAGARKPCSFPNACSTKRSASTCPRNLTLAPPSARPRVRPKPLRKASLPSLKNAYRSGSNSAHFDADSQSDPKRVAQFSWNLHQPLFRLHRLLVIRLHVRIARLHRIRPVRSGLYFTRRYRRICPTTGSCPVCRSALQVNP